MQHFDHVANLMRNHCKARYGINRDLYYNYVVKNMRYLRSVVREAPDDVQLHLRRSLPPAAAGASVAVTAASV